MEKENSQGNAQDRAAASRSVAWDLLDDRVASVFDALPATRVFEAFVDGARDRVSVPTLFSLCLCAAVPFAVVDAMLQDRYRVPQRPARHKRPYPHSPRKGVDDAGHNEDEEEGDNSGNAKTMVASTGHCGAAMAALYVPRPLPWPSPWASYCACRSCCYPYADVGGSPLMDCLRGRLVAIPPRTALRIVAWQWASAVTGCANAALRWPSAADVGPCPAPDPQHALGEDGYVHDKGAVVRIRSDGIALIGRWPCRAGAGDDDAPPFQHYGTPVRRLTHPWDTRVHVDVYDRTCPPADEDHDHAYMRRYLPHAVARVDGDPVFLVAVYKTTVMTL
ncbi:hypothetical protein psal_cds_1193 [Pandoravirus salinus]|uniref:Uncharacterized protein n=1 Tax=Pandoravirus salinus TaxID=1349410 RepID=S4W471_9VIRU|nr:hypothetical protein psal_cds_1193 [Pandoravirus salinus]AGO85482.1 hypothetical protein psal_cds_1193 [Pandoravirus salinus]